MAKQKYEDKRILNVVGVIDKNEDGEVMITVETKDEVTSFSFDEIITECNGREISFSCEF